MSDHENRQLSKPNKSKPNPYTEVSIPAVPGLFVRVKNDTPISYNLHVYVNGEHKRHVIGKARDIDQARAIDLARKLKQLADNEARRTREAKNLAAFKKSLKTTKPVSKLEGFSSVADAEKFVVALSDYWSLLPTRQCTLDNHQRYLMHETLKLLLLKMILPHSLSDLLTMTFGAPCGNGSNFWFIPNFKGKPSAKPLCIYPHSNQDILPNIINIQANPSAVPNCNVCFPLLRQLKPQDFKEQIKLICQELHLNSKLNPNRFTDFFKVIAQEHSPFKKEIIEAYAYGRDDWREIIGSTNSSGIFAWWMDRVMHADFSTKPKVYRRPLKWPFNAF